MEPKHQLTLVVETLLTGGAEHFVVRLANAMARDRDVMVIVTNGRLVADSVVRPIRDNVKIVSVVFPFERLLSKVDRLLFKLRLAVSLRELLLVKRLRQTLSDRSGIVHSHQFKVDRAVGMANLSLGLKHVTTIHGDYLTFDKQSVTGEHIKSFRKKAAEVVEQVDKIVCISDRQIEFFQTHFNVGRPGTKVIKIYNGVVVPDRPPVASLAAATKRNSFIFGMVARGIPEKGWEIAIQAFLLLKAPSVQLILVGQSDYLASLRLKYPQPEIVFSGFSDDPWSLIETFDVGLLPSYFSSESLPTSVIEYLSLGKPVIASDAGEISKMISDAYGAAGIVIDVHDRSKATHHLAQAMRIMLDDRGAFEQFASQTSRFASLFDMARCTDSYNRMYNALTTGKTSEDVSV